MLGRLPELGIAELQALLANGEYIESSNGIALLNLSKTIDNPQKTLDALGGTIKIGRVFDKIETQAINNTKQQNLIDIIAEKIAGRILQKFQSHNSKINYGISAYNIHNDYKNFLKNLLKDVKHQLKGAGKSSRFANNSFKNVHNVVAADLMKKGIEILVIECSHPETQTKIYLAETVAVQDFKSYELRDYGRPERNMDSGMLPPKIAQIMINLTGLRGLNGEWRAQTQKFAYTTKTQSLESNFESASKFASASKTQLFDPPIIYDPFCGSGTILQEALLMGFKAIGSDINKEAILNSEKNIKWLISQYRLNEAYFHVFQSDFKTADLPERINAIVSESYLGPRLTHPLKPEEARQTIKKLEELYIGALEKIKESRTICPVIFAIAAFKTGNNYIFAENFPIAAQKLGFGMKPLSKSARKSLIYDRPGQFVAREIFKFYLK